LVRKETVESYTAKRVKAAQDTVQAHPIIRRHFERELANATEHKSYHQNPTVPRKRNRK